MATKVPIPVSNIAFERLNLSRHYLTVDCDFTCFLVLNPSGSVPSEGTDICALHVGAWQIDAWTLLTKKDFPNQAGFSACLVWDKTLVSDSVGRPSIVESDIDTANSVSTLKGQPVNVTGFSMPDDASFSVVDVRKRFYQFFVGSAYSFAALREVGSSLSGSENDFDVYMLCPNSYLLENNLGDYMSFSYGKVIRAIPTNPPSASSYDNVKSFISLYLRKETSVLEKIFLDCVWKPSGSQNTGVDIESFDFYKTLTVISI